MKSGIVQKDEGYDIFVNGQGRTFRDVRAAAYDAAVFLKTRSKGHDKVEILDRATGQRIEMQTDGRTS